MIEWLSLGLMIVFTNISQVLVKKGTKRITFNTGLPFSLKSLMNKYLVTGAFFMFLAPLLYLIALREIPLNLAFSVTSINVILVQFTGNWFFNEPIAKQKLLGSFIIFLGLIIYTI